MSASTPEELAALKAVGRVVARTLRELRARVRPGVSTAELDEHAARIFAAHGARSGPRLDYDFPGAICISVGDEAVHGIPGPRRLKPGELVKLDVTAELDGFYADACTPGDGGRPAPADARLIAAADSALRRGMAVATAGAPLNNIGWAVQRDVERHGFSVCGELTGHGIGRRSHEEPTVYSVDISGPSPKRTAGLVIQIEPIIAAGKGRVVADGDWLIRPADRS